MPGEDFENYPILTDGEEQEDHTIIGGDILGKEWMESSLYPWILTLTRNSGYTNITPADLIDIVLRGNLYPPLSILSVSQFTRNSDVDSTSVFITGSFLNLAFDNIDPISFSGSWCSFASGSTYAIPQFTLQNGYRRVNIDLIQSEGLPLLYTSCSDEASAIEDLDDPGHYSLGTYYFSGYIIVQNDGNITGTGRILPINASDIVSLGLQLPQPTTQLSGLERSETWIGEGKISAISYMDGLRCPGVSGYASRFDVMCISSGTTGNPLVVTMKRQDGVTVSTITISVGLTNVLQSTTVFNILTFSSTDKFYIDILDTPNDAVTITCRFIYTT